MPVQLFSMIITTLDYNWTVQCHKNTSRYMYIYIHIYLYGRIIRSENNVIQYIISVKHNYKKYALILQIAKYKRFSN